MSDIPTPAQPPAATKTSKVAKAAATPAAKSAATTPAKAPAKKAAVTVKPAASAKTKSTGASAQTASPAEKTIKPKKPKMVRDSFSFPKAEYTVLQDLKERSNRLTHPAKKTELLRAAIKTLAALDDDAFLKAIRSVPSLKTGRPAKAKLD